MADLSFSGLIQETSLDPTVIKTSTLTLSAAQIVALDAGGTVTYDLVAAPGAGYSILPMQMLVQYRYAVAAFDGVGANDNFDVGFAGGATPFSISNVGVIDQTNNETRWCINTTTSLVTVSNTKIRIRLKSTGDGITNTGNGTGTVTFTIYYKIVADTGV